jgi:hypothetical protein
VSTGGSTVLGFSFSGSFISAGSGVLTTLAVSGTGEACLDNIIVAGSGGADIAIEIGSCATIDDPVCDDEDEDGICDDVDDCVGEYDECGVCNGDGIADGACDCDGNVADCAGECGGSAVEDECGVCNGAGPSFYCDSGDLVCSESDCPEPWAGVFDLALNDDGGVDVAYDCNYDIYGFHHHHLKLNQKHRPMALDNLIQNKLGRHCRNKNLDQLHYIHHTHPLQQNHRTRLHSLLHYHHNHMLHLQYHHHYKHHTHHIHLHNHLRHHKYHLHLHHHKQDHQL